MTLPAVLRWPWEGWKKFSHLLGTVVSKILLSLLWLVGFGAYGIAMKIAALFHAKEAPRSTYWIDVEPTTADSYKRQF